MINGIINVYKEKGYTSFDVVAKMRGIFHQKKIGHTGTLDPDAEGVLPVCLGKATKVCDLLTDKDKEYKAVLLLGQATDTQDISGEVVKSSEVTVTEEQVKAVISSFVGKQLQVPPMYSALKVNGQKLCDLARQGVTVERKAREINIFSIDILDISLPEVTILVHCSKGTYIRTLCNDIGEKLGCFGCMKSLLRTRVSCFELKDSYKLSELQELVNNIANENDIEFTKATKNFVMPIDSVFDMLSCVKVSDVASKLVQNGNRISSEYVVSLEDDANEFRFTDMEQYRLYDWDNNFIGIYKFIDVTNDFKPVKIFKE